MSWHRGRQDMEAQQGRTSRRHVLDQKRDVSLADKGVPELCSAGRVVCEQKLVQLGHDAGLAKADKLLVDGKLAKHGLHDGRVELALPRVVVGEWSSDGRDFGDAQKQT